jgi:hypothetical protein
LFNACSHTGPLPRPALPPLGRGGPTRSPRAPAPHQKNPWQVAFPSAEKPQLAMQQSRRQSRMRSTYPRLPPTASASHHHHQARFGPFGLSVKNRRG